MSGIQYVTGKPGVKPGKVTEGFTIVREDEKTEPKSFTVVREEPEKTEPKSFTVIASREPGPKEPYALTVVVNGEPETDSNEIIKQFAFAAGRLLEVAAQVSERNMDGIAGLLPQFITDIERMTETMRKAGDDS